MSRRNKKKEKAPSEPAPLIEDPLKGAALPSHIASLLTYDKMLEREQSKQYDVSMLEQNIRLAEERAVAEGRDPKVDESVQQFRLYQLQRAEDEEAVDKLLAQRSRATYAHTAAMSSKSGADPTHRIPSMRLAKRTYWPTRRVPDDQTAHVMWARTASILSKYYQILAMQEHMSGEGGRRNMHMPRYHDYEKWIEQHFRVPVVLVRRNASARQTWLGQQDRQPAFFMQRPFDVPMPQSNHHGAFQNASSQNDDLLHEVRYLNMLELSALALLSTSRPGACFEFEWDGTLPGVDVFDLRPDNAPHKFVWDDRKAREYSGDRAQAARYVSKNFPEQRIDVYETFLRFDSEAFEQRQGTFDDDPNEFWVPQNREVLFDQFYVHANTFEDPVEDGKALAETHAAVLRMFTRAEDKDQSQGEQYKDRVFPTADQVLVLLESGHSNLDPNIDAKDHRSTKNAWSERRRTSPYNVVVDQQDVTERGNAGEALRDDEEFPYDVISLEEYTLRQQKEEREHKKKQEASFRYQKASKVPPADSNRNMSRQQEGLHEAEFEEASNPVPSETLRRNQKFADSQREKDQNEWLLDDITRLPYYRDLYNDLETIAGPEWALPTSDSRQEDGGNRPVRITKYQYVRAFIYLAVRQAKQLRPEASPSEIAELVLPTSDRNAMTDIRQWLTKRRKQQRETPNFRAWSADILKAVDVWMTRVCEAVEFCYHNDPGPEKRTSAASKKDQEETQCSDAEEKTKQRTDMWRRVEALFPPGIVSMMPEAWRKNEPVPPLPCDRSNGSVKIDRKEQDRFGDRQEDAEHPDAFGVPKIAQVDRLYQELFIEEPRTSDWIEDRYKGTGSTQYWEDSQRQETLSKTSSGAPTRGDRVNPLLCSRHFRNVVLPSGGAALPAWSQREHWVPMYYAEEESGESGDDSAKDKEWTSLALVYDSVSQLLFPERRGAKQSRGAAAAKKKSTNNSRRNTVTRIGGKSSESKEKTKRGLSALLASSRTKRGGGTNSRQNLPTEEDVVASEEGAEAQEDASPLQWNWSNYRDETFLRGTLDHDTLSPFDVVEKLKRSDPHYEKRHPNLVHGDVFSLDDGSGREHIDALFSIVTEPLMDARHLHTHDQVDVQGRVDNESNQCFAESVQRPLNNNPFYRFFHLFLTTCSANDLPQVSVDEWEQIEQFSRRVLYALEPLEFDQSRLCGDDRFVAKAVDGRLRANQKSLRATGEQPSHVQAGTRALQTLSYAFRSARFAKVIERVETMLGYVPWIHRENVLQPFFDQDAPFSTLYDYGVNACVSLRDNARFHPRGRHPHASADLLSHEQQDEEQQNNEVLRQAAEKQSAKKNEWRSLSAAHKETLSARQVAKEQQETRCQTEEEEKADEEEEEENMWSEMKVTVDVVSDREKNRVEALKQLKKDWSQKSTSKNTAKSAQPTEADEQADNDYSDDDLMIQEMLDSVMAAQAAQDAHMEQSGKNKEEPDDCVEDNASGDKEEEEEEEEEGDSDTDDDDSDDNRRKGVSAFKLWQSLAAEPCETRHGSRTRRSSRLKQKTVAATLNRSSRTNTRHSK